MTQMKQLSKDSAQSWLLAPALKIPQPRNELLSFVSPSPSPEMTIHSFLWIYMVIKLPPLGSVK